MRSANPSNKENLEKNFKQLENAIKVIYLKKQSTLKFEECYRSGYNLVLYTQGDKLYKFVQNLLKLLLEGSIDVRLSQYFSHPTDGAQASDVSLGSLVGLKNIQFLKELELFWDDYMMSLSRIASILLYLDNQYLKKHQQPSINDIGIQIFYGAVIQSKKLGIRQLLVDIVVEEICKERAGQFVQRSPLKANTKLLLAIGKSVYEEILEHSILESTSKFYATEARRLNTNGIPSTFIQEIYKGILEEKDRCDSYLTSETCRKLLEVIDRECLIPYFVENVKNESNGLKSMLANDAMDDLIKMFTLASRIQSTSFKPMIEDFKNFIIGQGEVINTEIDAKLKSEPQLTIALHWVDKIVALKRWADNLCTTCFQENISFNAGSNEAFVTVINNLSRSAEFISLYIDHHMKEDFKRKGDSKIEPILDRAVHLFRFLGDRDIFEKYYKQHLAKRLLSTSMSASGGSSDTFQDAEKVMITKLQAECGFQFTMKIEGMFNDVQLSHELTKRFKANRETLGEALPFNFQASILTNNFWPIKTAPPSQLNLDLNLILKKFTQFYNSEFSGRKLEWITSFGNAELKMIGAKNPHDLIVTCHQMIVLMLFNDEDGALNYEDIESKSQIEENELKRTLQSLSCGKYKILVKSTKTKNILPDDRFEFNQGFTNPQYRIKIPMVSGRIETGIELKETLNQIEDSRKYLIDASIVRIMKDRKVLNHNLLIVEVTKQLSNRFKMSPNLIKLRIENLIDREYLARDDDDRTTYKYLA